MGNHLQTLSKRINSLVSAFNTFNSSLDRNVVTQAKRFSELQGIESPLESPPPLEVLAVPAQKPELYSADQVDAELENHPGSNNVEGNARMTRLSLHPATAFARGTPDRNAGDSKSR